MAIQSISNVSTSNAATQTKSANKTASDSIKQPVGLDKASDTVSISAGPNVQRAFEIIDATPVVNESRVAEIKAALDAGTYQINPDRIAAKMLQQEAEITNSS